jgi:AcrR family transcriptional regulator
MPSDDVRDRMIDGTIELLASQGLQGTSFTEIIANTKTPRGSIYHHFPSGKDQLVEAAIERVASRTLRALSKNGPLSADQVAQRFIDMWRTVLLASRFGSGCSIVAVTVAADTPSLSASVGEIFGSWRADLASLLVTGGLDPDDAEEYSATLIAACEGAVVLSRAERSIEPFDLVAGVMRRVLADLLTES